MDIHEAREIREVLREINKYSLRDLKQTLYRLEAATTEAKQTIADVHSAAKDLRASIREARTLLATGVSVILDAKVDAAVSALGEASSQAMRDSVARVIAEFDKLGALLLEADKNMKKQSMEDVIRAVVAKPGSGLVDKVPVAWQARVKKD